MDREQKQQLVANLNEGFNNAATVIVAHYKGLSVSEITELRKNLTKLGASFRVTKNSLAKRALEKTPHAPLAEFFSGPTAIASSDDPVAAAKGICEFAKENEKLQILAGCFNENVMTLDEVKALSKLPSLDELRAKIVGMLNTPATRIAGVLQAPGSQCARTFGAYAQKG